MKEELRIFDRTQGEVAQYGDSLQISSCRAVSSKYDCQPTPSQGAMFQLGVLIQISLENMIASKSELRSKSVEDKLSLRYDMMRSAAIRDEEASRLDSLSPYCSRVIIRNKFDDESDDTIPQ
ncbi:hypothetical protein TIFTF001_054998 [Ficus carica]|uniref:Uncharacterized protein n=1 Tax=Ficus carica TaxID=3494 RepID=A0AA88EM84_FICCA|nr:hypothetical protein TIFTF001_054997 [Ficus carica]GMN74386.1 hypothetical protein TIFTF001_054998 [Ficus carica]